MLLHLLDGPYSLVFSHTSGFPILANLLYELTWYSPDPLDTLDRVLVKHLSATGRPTLLPRESTPPDISRIDFSLVHT